MIPNILNLPYSMSPAPIGSGGAPIFDLVSPAAAWLIMLLVLAIYGVMMQVVTKPRPRVRIVHKRRPRAVGLRSGFSTP